MTTSFKTRLLALLLLSAVTLPIAARDARVVDPVVRPSFELAVLAASGVSSNKLDHYTIVLDRLAQELLATYSPGDDARLRALAIHAFLHERVLGGKFEAGASQIGSVLDGGPYNCAATSALFLLLAARCGLEAHAVSVPGHVWCRVTDRGHSFDVETTCRTWFTIVDRSTGLAAEKVSPVMATHRRRLPLARDLSEPQLLAIFHYNRGVTYLRHQQFAAAAASNRLALTLDPACQPAHENLAAALDAQSEVVSGMETTTTPGRVQGH